MLIIKTQDFEPVYLKLPNGQVGTVRITKDSRGHHGIGLDLPQEIVILRRELWELEERKAS